MGCQALVGRALEAPSPPSARPPRQMPKPYLPSPLSLSDLISCLPACHCSLSRRLLSPPPHPSRSLTPLLCTACGGSSVMVARTCLGHLDGHLDPVSLRRLQGCPVHAHTHTPRHPATNRNAHGSASLTLCEPPGSVSPPPPPLHPTTQHGTGGCVLSRNTRSLTQIRTVRVTCPCARPPRGKEGQTRSPRASSSLSLPPLSVPRMTEDPLGAPRAPATVSANALGQRQRKGVQLPEPVWRGGGVGCPWGCRCVYTREREGILCGCVVCYVCYCPPFMTPLQPSLPVAALTAQPGRGCCSRPLGEEP